MEEQEQEQVVVVRLTKMTRTMVTMAQCTRKERLGAPVSFDWNQKSRQIRCIVTLNKTKRDSKVDSLNARETAGE